MAEKKEDTKPDSIAKLSLHQKIVCIMSEVQKLQKDDLVQFGKTKYKALSEEKVTAIMHDKLVKYHIVIYPIAQEWERTGQITHINVRYRIVNADDVNDFIEVVSCGDGADTQDKGSGKAMTYAFKYMWLRTFALPTGEDPDKISSDELDANQDAKEAVISEKEAAILANMLTEEQMAWVQKKYGELVNLTKEQYASLINTLRKREESGNESKNS